MLQGESQPAPPGSQSPEPEPQEPSTAWQPFTFRGVAAFARASLLRLFLVELVVASLAAGTVVWFLFAAWFPTMRAAVRQLPDQGVIQHQELFTPLTAAQTLAESCFLAVVVDAQNSGRVSPTADLCVVMRQHEVRVGSLLGCCVFRYPKQWAIEFNRRELEPRWQAWEPFVLGLAGLVVATGLMLLWALLATLDFMVAWLVAFYADRDLGRAASWRLAAAALLPGAGLFTLAIGLYGLGIIDLLRLGIIAVLHVIVGWIYLVVSPLTLPKTATAAPTAPNPFAAPQSDTTPAAPPEPKT